MGKSSPTQKKTTVLRVIIAVNHQQTVLLKIITVNSSKLEVLIEVLLLMIILSH